MKTEKPNDLRLWRDSVYSGDVYKLPVSSTSMALAEAVVELLEDVFATEKLHDIHNQLAEADFFSAMKVIRRELFEAEKYIQLLAELLSELGFKPGELAFEPLRLRAIRHNAHLNPRARAVFYPHRDTWYGHGQSMIVGWVPLHDQSAEQTFEIYPQWFDLAVPNNSEVFDYDAWRQGGAEKKIGWQKKDTGITAVYPEATGEVEISKRITFAADKGENLLFSGAHFHRTLKQVNQLSRFSVDYRFVYLKDHCAGIGAPNADNRSKGSAVQDYIRL